MYSMENTSCQQRKCYSCQETKPLTREFFSTCKEHKSGLRFICKACSSKVTIARQKQQKLKWLTYKGGKCEVCGYDKSVRALHFHHKNPHEKDFTLGKYRSRSWLIVKAELDKCSLLCANCHAEIHDKIFTGEWVWMIRRNTDAHSVCLLCKPNE